MPSVGRTMRQRVAIAEDVHDPRQVRGEPEPGGEADSKSRVPIVKGRECRDDRGLDVMVLRRDIVKAGVDVLPEGRVVAWEASDIESHRP